MSDSNVQPLEKISSEVIESQFKIILSSQCIKEPEREVAETEASGKRARTRPSWPAPAPPPSAVSTLPPLPEERVDIRMIDFAHTAFAGAAAESPLATATPHHGPDCGFLTGIDSLKRLLTEILHPQPYS